MTSSRNRCTGRIARKDWQSPSGPNPHAEHVSSANRPAGHHEQASPSQTLQFKHCSQVRARCISAVASISPYDFVSCLSAPITLAWFSPTRGPDTTSFRVSVSAATASATATPPSHQSTTLPGIARTFRIDWTCWTNQSPQWIERAGNRGNEHWRAIRRRGLLPAFRQLPESRGAY